MKLSDYVARFLSLQGIRHVFAVSGGASLHLIHSVAETPGIEFVCPQHEQAGAMAADAYARVTGNLGAAMATSGPGATNMITGVCCAYYDSVPVIYITGQVSTFRMKGDSGVRQMGFQETDTVEIYKPITKYAVQIKDPQRIRFELEKAVHVAKSGRPGPVLVDIPDDVQRRNIDADRLEPFVPTEEKNPPGPSDEQVRRCIELLNDANRPVLIFGWGIRLAKAEKEAKALLDGLGFPVALTWAALDMVPSNHPLVAGAFGTHGTRHGNFAVQNADLLVVVGARLDTREAGSPMTTFARGARKIVADIDLNELNKFKTLGLDVDVLIHSDAKKMLRSLNRRMGEISPRDISAWKARINGWKTKFLVCPPKYYEQKEVNPYVFVKALSHEAAEGDVILVDTGCAVAWMTQGFDFKANQRLYHDFNNTAMGYALPAAIGACFALNRRPIICVTGDGSLQMNIQEMATVIRHWLPIKIFLLNNHGYSMIQQTQDQWMGSQYLGSTVEGGLAFPDFVRVAEAYGYKALTIDCNRGMNERVREVLDWEGPVFCNVEISPSHRVIPQVKYGRPIEDSEPLLDRRLFLENMIVKPLEEPLR